MASTWLLTAMEKSGRPQAGTENDLRVDTTTSKRFDNDEPLQIKKDGDSSARNGHGEALYGGGVPVASNPINPIKFEKPSMTETALFDCEFEFEFEYASMRQ